jgi:hypothetical protein
MGQQSGGDWVDAQEIALKTHIIKFWKYCWPPKLTDEHNSFNAVLGSRVQGNGANVVGGGDQRRPGQVLLADGGRMLLGQHFAEA